MFKQLYDDSSCSMTWVIAGWLPANPGNISTASSDCMGESQRQCVVFHCMWPDLHCMWSPRNNICCVITSTHHRIQRSSPPGDLPCRDQGLFPSLGPSPIDPHPGCGPRSIGLVGRTSSAHPTLHLFGASDVAPLWCHSHFSSQPRWPDEQLGLTNQMNIVAIGPHLCQSQSSLLLTLEAIHSLTHTASHN